MRESDSDDDFETCRARWMDSLEKPFSFDDMLKELESHPAFMKKMPDDGNISDEILALQMLKYDEEESAEGQALGLKNDGNKWFELKQYRRAIDDYTEGIKKQCIDKELNAVLYSNRAAANLRLGNVRSALRDCSFARKFSPAYWKAVSRGVLCLIRLHQPSEAMEWLSEYASNCTKPLPQDFDSMHAKVENELHKVEQQRAITDRRVQEEDACKMRLLASFEERRLKFLSSESHTGGFDWSILEVNLHGANSHVHFDEHGALIWPVLLKYPEFETEDFICNFHECNTFAEELEIILSCDEGEPRLPAYGVQNIEIYYLLKDTENAYRCLPITCTLLEAITQKDYWIDRGLPTFYCLSRASSFFQKFLARKVVLSK
uniref:Cns1/TTC4 wheel domain-containing protein n=1 Tax=Trichuris muris TaxID=70415 RepID=A0A5S6QFD4_TRIMR